MVPEISSELLGSSEVNLQSTFWALQLQSIFTEDALKIRALSVSVFETYLNEITTNSHQRGGKSASFFTFPQSAQYTPVKQ